LRQPGGGHGLRALRRGRRRRRRRRRNHRGSAARGGRGTEPGADWPRYRSHSAGGADHQARAPAAHLRRGAGVYLLRFPQGSDRRTDTGRRRCRRQGAGNSQEHRSAHRRRLRHPRCRFSGRGGQGGRCGGGWQRAGASGRAASRRHVQATGSNGRPGRRLAAGDRYHRARRRIRGDKNMSWFKKLMPSRIRTEAGQRSRVRSNVPEGLWTKCTACNAVLYRPELERNLEVCPKCNHHLRISARRRLETFLDSSSRSEIGAEIKPVDILRFRDSKRYKDRLAQAQKETGEDDALVVMRGTLKGMPVVAAAFEFNFMGGSMGSVVGERFVRAANIALQERIPLICFSASGGARMQEALFSLMQMAKTSAILARLREAGVPYISVLTDPTMGGVSASLAMLGDVNVAEPGALIGFAGPRV